jgi:hypothetical protein
MAKRLTEEQKQKIIADYIQLRNFSEVGRQNGVAEGTVRNIVKKSDSCELAKKYEEKNEQVTHDILAHMETKKKMVNEIIDVYLKALLDRAVIAKSSASQLTTALGTLIDKFTMAAVSRPADAEDDPLTKSLMEEAERMNNADQH